MGKQSGNKLPSLEELGITDTPKLPTLDELGLKKKASLGASASTLQTSSKPSQAFPQSTGFDAIVNPFQNTQEKFIGKERTNQVFQQQAYDEAQRKKNTANLQKAIQNVEKVSSLPYSNKTREEIYRMDASDIVKAERQKEASARANYESITKDLSLGDIFSNSANNAWVQIKKNIPQLNILAADVFENILGKENAKAYYEWEGRDINAIRSQAYKELEDLDNQLKATGGSVSDNIKYLNGTGLVGNLVDAVFNVGSTAVPALLTGGGVTATSMTGQAIADYNNAKAKSKGISVEELYNRGEAELGTPLLLGSVATGLELIGLKGTQQALLGQLKGSYAKKAAIFAFEANKEGITEWVQTGLDAANNALAEGKDLSQASKDAVSKMFSKDGLDSYLMGTFGSLGAAGVGRVVSQVIKPNSQQKVISNIEELSVLEQDLSNPNLSESAKNIIASQAQQKINEISKIVDEDINQIDNISNQDKVKINALNDEKIALSEILLNQEVSDASKSSAESRISEIDKELNEIKPKEQVVFTYESLDEVPDSLVDDVVEEDGKYTVRMPKEEADVLQQQIKNGEISDMVLMEGRTEPLSPNRIENIVEVQPQVTDQIKAPTKEIENQLKKEGVDFVYKNNPKLSDIGTKEQYEEYLKTIFPESKLKDIVYRTSINENALKSPSGILFFSGDREYGEIMYPQSTAKTYAALLNLENPNVIKGLDFMDVKDNPSSLEGYDSLVGDLRSMQRNPSPYSHIQEITINDKNQHQVHILGSEKDVQGFREFLKNENAIEKIDNAPIANIVNKSLELYEQIQNTDGAAKKRRLAEERRALLESNPKLKLIDDNISDIYNQLRNKNIIETKGKCL